MSDETSAVESRGGHTVTDITRCGEFGRILGWPAMCVAPKGCSWGEHTFERMRPPALGASGDPSPAPAPSDEAPLSRAACRDAVERYRRAAAPPSAAPTAGEVLTEATTPGGMKVEDLQWAIDVATTEGVGAGGMSPTKQVVLHVDGRKIPLRSAAISMSDGAFVFQLNADDGPTVAEAIAHVEAGGAVQTRRWGYVDHDLALNLLNGFPPDMHDADLRLVDAPSDTGAKP